MRIFLLLSLLLTLATCRESATAQVSDTVVGQVDSQSKLREDPQDAGNGEKALVLRMASATAVTGQRVCLPVAAGSFTNLIGYQFTMQFDSAALVYDGVRNFGVPGLGEANFGTRVADRGIVSTLWTDGGLKGVNLPEGATLFEVCFTNIQEAGEETEVKFLNKLTPFEVIDEAMGQWKIRYANGQVRSR